MTEWYSKSLLPVAVWFWGASAVILGAIYVGLRIQKKNPTLVVLGMKRMHTIHQRQLCVSVRVTTSGSCMIYTSGMVTSAVIHSVNTEL